MPFDLSAKNIFRYTSDAFGITLNFRFFEPEERKVFDKNWTRHVNMPEPKGVSKQEAAEREVARKRAIFREAATKLLDGWAGVTDGGKPVEFSPASAEKFLANPETRRFWEPAISALLWPGGRVADEEATEEELTFRPGT